MLFVLLLSGAACLAQVSDYRTERVVLPINVEPTHGAFDSLWISETWIRNGSNSPLYISPLLYADWFVFPGATLIPPLWPQPVGAPAGDMIRIGSTEPARIQFNLRIRDTSRLSESWGTELPVVRESEFLAEKIVLLNIPASHEFRRRLRIYEALISWPPGHSGGDVMVRIFSIPENQFLWERRVSLAGQRTLAYGEIPLDSQFEGHNRARVEIEPLRPWMKIWAFISITHNEAQQVTTVTPQ